MREGEVLCMEIDKGREGVMNQKSLSDYKTPKTTSKSPNN